jgi:hypothetical protein
MSKPRTDAARGARCTDYHMVKRSMYGRVVGV